MALTSPPTAVAPFDTGRLSAGISASATTIYVSPIYKTINGVRTKQGFDTTSGLAIISQGDYTERISFESASVNSTTKITTLSSCTRGLSVTSTSASFTGGTGRAWSKGATITVVADASYFQSGVFTNVANTFTAKQTLSAGADFTSVTRPPKLPNLTQAQENALTPEEGMMWKNTDTGTNRQYTGGSISSIGTDATANGSTTVAGKFEEATVAEQGSATATGSTGARLVPAVANLVKTSSGSGDENKIAVLNASGQYNIGFLASGTPTGSKFVRDDGTLAVPSITSTDYLRAYKSTAILLASKDAVGNTVSETAFSTTYTIPANFFLATGDAMLMNLFGYTQSKPSSAGTITLKLKFGSTTLATLMTSTMTDNTEQPWSSDIRIVCANQGASGKLYVDSYVRYEGSSTKDYYTHAYDSNNSSLGISFDTTSSASLTLTCQFSVAVSTNYCVLDWMNINKLSTTAF